MGYKTPETMPTSFFCGRFFIPNDPYVLGAVRGALAELTKPHNWTELGAITPDEMADAMLAMYDEMFAGDVCMLGSLVHYVTDTVPTGLLPCDGTGYERVDYPRLYAVLPASLIVDADNFITPTVEDVFLLGAGTTYSPEDVGGVVEHTLTESELPEHSHLYDKPTLNIDVESVGVPDPSGVGLPMLPTATSTVGNDEAHENMPPFIAYKVGIVAR